MKTRTVFFVTAVVATLLLSNCKKKEKDPEPEPIPTAPSLIPTVSTAAVINITDSTATSGGTVTLEGASAIISVGVCWDTLPNPTTLKQLTYNGAGTGNYISKMTGLRVNTKYYLRAYATNANGTAYGNEVSFSTPSYNFWNKTNVSNTYTVFNCMFSEGASIYAGTTNGVIFSSDTGTTWAPKGLANSSISTLIKKGNFLYAIDNSSILHRSSNNGTSWTSLNANFPYPISVNDVAVQGSKLIAGTDSSAFASSDDGDSWTRINAGLPEVSGSWGGGSVQQTASSGPQVYGLANYFVGPGYSFAIYKYDEPNNTWNSVLGFNNTPAFSDLEVSGNSVFVASFDYYLSSSKVQSSSDGGNSWQTVDTEDGANVSVFGNSVFIGNSYGDFKLSQNSGSTWTKVKSLGLPSASATIPFSQYGQVLASRYFLWINTKNGVFKCRYN